MVRHKPLQVWRTSAINGSLPTILKLSSSYQCALDIASLLLISLSIMIRNGFCLWGALTLYFSAVASKEINMNHVASSQEYLSGAVHEKLMGFKMASLPFLLDPCLTLC